MELEASDLVQAELVLVRRLRREGYQVQTQLFDGESEEADQVDRLFREGWGVMATLAAGRTALRLVLGRRK